MKKQIRTSKLSFNAVDMGGTQSLFIGQAGIQLGRFTQPEQKDFEKSMESFGMFGNSHDGNKYYPDATAQSLLPKAEDFWDVNYRFLTATIVGGGSWKATDFSNVAALKAATSKLNAKPIYPNHDPELFNFLGIVANTYWDEGGLQGSVHVPPGINGTMRLDAKTNPKIVRGIMMGAIFSNSVTVSFDWEPSHPFESENEFNNAVGSLSKVDGKMITRKVTKIHDFFETSLVWLGADPFSKMLDANGELINIDESSISFSKVTEADKEKFEKEKIFSIDTAIDKNILSLSKERFNTPVITEEKPKDNMKFLAAFIAAFGATLNISYKEGDELTPELEQKLAESLAKLGLKNPTQEAELTSLSQFVSGLQQFSDVTGTLIPLDVTKLPENVSLIATAEGTRLHTELTRLTPLATEGETYLSNKRAECVRQYGLASGGKNDEAVLAMINSADSKVLDGLMVGYGKKATDEFSAFCTSCKSGANIEMRSSVDEGTEDAPDAVIATDSASLRAKYGSKSMFLGSE